jgi:uroporphyrinogen decarboxylase
MFQQFSLTYTQKVLSKLKTTHAGEVIPRIVFTKGGGLWLSEMSELSCEVLGVDWTVNLGHARKLVSGQVGTNGKALQGNLDPNSLFAPPQAIATEARRVLDSFGPAHTDRDQSGPTHIFNLGHGISQFTPPDHVAALVETVHEHSRNLRKR